MNQLKPVAAPRFRLALAMSLGAISIGVGLLLALTDGLDESVRWTHHAGISAAPLLLVAGAIPALTIASPPKGRHALLRLVAVIAFATWGLAQLFPNSGAAGGLGDVAILLFVVDAGCFVISDARSHLRSGRQATDKPGTGSDPGKIEWTTQLSPAVSSTAIVAPRSCCTRSADLCACASSR